MGCIANNTSPGKGQKKICEALSPLSGLCFPTISHDSRLGLPSAATPLLKSKSGVQEKGIATKRKRALFPAPAPQVCFNHPQPSVNDLQLVGAGRRASFAELAEVRVVVIELVKVDRGFFTSGHWHETFPTVVHQVRAAHRIGFLADHHGHLDGIPAQRLLARVEGDFNGIKVFSVTQLALRREIRGEA